jgi:hypothetical protein
MKVFADIGKFYLNLVKGNFRTGRTVMDQATRNSPPLQGRIVVGAVDVLAGSALAGFFGFQAVNCAIGIGLAVAAVVTGGAAIPATLAVVGINTLFGALSVLMASMGLGFLAAAGSKLPNPKPALSRAGHAAQDVGHTVAKPFRWTANKLGQAFKKAHDGGSTPPQGPGPKAALRLNI